MRSDDREMIRADFFFKDYTGCCVKNKQETREEVNTE
jgi:hypothetical protein